jgi:hypothetical protein
MYRIAARILLRMARGFSHKWAAAVADSISILKRCRGADCRSGSPSRPAAADPICPPTDPTVMNPTIRIVTRGSNGELRTKDYEKHDTVLKMHTQIGVDDCSTDLSLRGMPVFRGLIGPMPEAKGVVRYETPEVFETLTKEWTAASTGRRRRRTQAPQ